MLLTKNGQPLLSEAQIITEERHCMLQDKEFVGAEDRSRTLREDVLDRHQRRVHKRSLGLPKRKAPLTCDCSSKTHQKRVPKASISAEGGEASRSKREGALENLPSIDADGIIATESRAELDRGTTASSRSTEAQPEDETIAKTCSRCHHFKTPPRGKKLAWRGQKARWMYVCQDAPDEIEGEEDEHLQSRDGESNAAVQDECDEENNAKIPGDAQSTTENLGSDTTQSQITTSEAAPTEANTTTGSAIELKAQAVKSSTNPQRLDVSADVPEANTVSDPQVATRTANTVGKMHQAPESSRATFNVDVDLTTGDDDADEVILVRSEKVQRAGDKDNEDSRSGEVEDLQYELEKLDCKRRLIEIEEQQADIKRKLAKHGGVKKVQQVKEEIKIEH